MKTYSPVPNFLRSAAIVAVLLAGVASARAAAAFPDAGVLAFTDRYCTTCHNDVDREGGLDLTSLAYTPEAPDNFQTWVKVHDRVQAGEMPPKEKKRPAAADVSAFIKGLSAALVTSEKSLVAKEGRSTRRRLNRYEYQNALRDLFHAPWLKVMTQLPEDGEAYRFNKVSEALDVSYVQMQRYMGAADYAMREAIREHVVRPETVTRRYYAREEPGLTRFRSGVDGNPSPDRNKFPALGNKAQPDVRALQGPLTVGEADPATRELEAVGWVSSNYPPGAFDLAWTNFRAPAPGRYHVTFSGYTLWVGPNGFSRPTRGVGANKVQIDGPPTWYLPNFDDVTAGRRAEPITIYSREGANYRRLGAFDLTPEPSVRDIGTVWLMADEVLVTDSTRFYRSRPPKYTNILAQRDGMPAVAFRWMEIEGPLYDQDTDAGYKLLFGDLPVREKDRERPVVDNDNFRGRARGGRRGPLPAWNPQFEVVSENPQQDAERLIRTFLPRAYRGPVAESDMKRFFGLFQARFEKSGNFTESMLAAYTAVLSSPAFVYCDEAPGPLNDHALATRLSLFLWNSEPDQALRARAARGELKRPEVLREEVSRMLADPRSSRFVEAFLDYWLDLRKMDDTNPATALYNDYYLDESLFEASLDETRMFFTDILKRNLPVRNIVDSDFTFINERLARHYGMAGVNGAAMRRVALPAESPRGGLLTQASVLKVTANGTTTSPVLRGKWIMERIAGFDLPPPPASVPAVEPDIRGAVTIRQQLEKHRADESCAQCHRKIDPPGFALESFDVMGGWRDRYRATANDAEPAIGMGHNGQPFAFFYAQPVDPSGQLPDGRAFKDVREFKGLLLQDETQLARNLVRQLTVYATGAPIRFSDRARVEEILQKAKPTQYGVRTLIGAIVESELFRNK